MSSTAQRAQLAPDLGARDRMLAATERCLARSGIKRTTMTEIAAEAGVSRAWLYRNFPNKAALVVASLARTDETFWTEAHARVARHRNLPAQVAEAVRLSREHPPPGLLLRLKTEEPEEFARTVGIGLREMMPGMALFWHRYLEDAKRRDEVRADLNVPRAAEWIMRLVLSLVTVPGEMVDANDPVAVRALLEEFLAPGLR